MEIVGVAHMLRPAQIFSHNYTYLQTLWSRGQDETQVLAHMTQLGFDSTYDTFDSTYATTRIKHSLPTISSSQVLVKSLQSSCTDPDLKLIISDMTWGMGISIIYYQYIYNDLL